MTSKELVALQFEYKDFAFEKNFDTLSLLTNKAPDGSVVCAPELCLSSFCYEDMQKASDFSNEIEEEIAKLSKNKTLCLTMLEKEDKKFVNRAKIYHNQKLIYQRDKYRLFKFGNEDRYFKSGRKEEIRIIEIGGIKYAVLICFELRFIDLWEIIKGADIILIPSLWGKARKKHLEILGNALSLANQCFVIVSNSSNKDMAKSSHISSPFGKFYKDDRKKLLLKRCDLKEIKKMRRYLDVGIKG